MQDRIPLYPGRVKMTPVAGQANTYDMVRADDPTQAGTPLNKASLLKDATAALYGKTSAAVPDDILSLLSKSVLAQTTAKYTKHVVDFSDYAVEDVVTLKIGDTPREFIVVQQGKPSDLYDESCNGTWLLMKDCYNLQSWIASDKNIYETSGINTWLNNDFIGLFDDSVQSTIKQVKIPYRSGGGYDGTDQSGANGLSCKAFLLSGPEVGSAEMTYMPVDGAKLAYFESGTDTSANNKRIANFGSSATNWWLRSPSTNFVDRVWYVKADGSCNYVVATNSYSIRPCIILPSDAEYVYYTDEAGNIYTEQEYDTMLTNVLGGKLTVGVQIETGSYIGTGTSGEGGKSTLTFQFTPYIVILNTTNPNPYNGVPRYFMLLSPCAKYCFDANHVGGITWGNRSVSWYSDGPTYQINVAGTTYHYIAIGV